MRYYWTFQIILVGDFNVWVDVEGNLDAKKLLKVMNTFGLSQLIHEPTHDDGHTLDHVYVNKYQLDLNVHVEERLGVRTDHFPIVVNVPVM